MKVLAYAMDLVDDPVVIESYKYYHKNIYEEVLRAGEQQGIRKQAIYRCGNRLFMIMEVEDFYSESNMACENVSDREREWDEIMRKMQLPLQARQPGEWWAKMEKVFDRTWFCQNEEC